MSETKRATWAEFASFMDSRCDWPTSEGDAIKRCAAKIRSKRDAQIAYAAAYGYGDNEFERDVAAWFYALRDQGVEPPADPPSVAEVLEVVASEIADAGNTFCADLSGDEAHRIRLAFGCSVAIARTVAKDFA